MTFRQVLAAILVRCYPEPWRREYGAEFRDLLETCPLTAAGVADVIVCGIRQRASAASVASIRQPPVHNRRVTEAGMRGARGNTSAPAIRR